MESNKLRKLLPKATVLGLDISSEGTQKSKTNFNLDQTQADINQPPFSKESFDGIHCKDVLIHILNKEDFLKKISHMLKPGGIFVLVSADNSYSAMKQFRWNKNKLVEIAKRHDLVMISDNKQFLDIEDWYTRGPSEREERVFLLFKKDSKKEKLMQKILEILRIKKN